jgi:hypothetical protein
VSNGTRDIRAIKGSLDKLGMTAEERAIKYSRDGGSRWV